MCSEEVQVPPGDIERVVNWGILTGKCEVQPFLGVVHFHRDHIFLFAKVAEPLYDVMGQTTIFVWSEGQQKSFDVLKAKLTEAPVLSYKN